MVIVGPIHLMEIQPSMIHLHLLNCEEPTPASLESVTARELSLNGALREKLAQYMFATLATLIMHILFG